MNQLEALRINTAACHGTLREYREATRENRGAHDEASSWLIELGEWVLDCIGAKVDEGSFWRGWEAEEVPEGRSEIETLGHMCRTSVEEHARRCAAGEISRESAMMYNCYAKALKEPRRVELVSYDSHLEDKEEDLKTSELVFEIHFKHSLRKILLDYAKDLGSRKRLVIADIGAGNGRVLEFAAECLEETDCAFRIIAMDPSETARKICKERLRMRETIVTGAALEDACEGRVKELRELREDEVLLILMKGVLHDRNIDCQEESTSEEEGIYRDKDWRRVYRRSIIKDLTMRLNGLRKYQTDSKLIIMESHLVSRGWIKRLFKLTPLMPAYIGHAITAQYLISASDHFQGICASDWRIKNFQRLCQLDADDAIMTIAT
ncbi:class I SAM-dependent methyltransferase, partial [bacterium]|nr:class I SAM-dependent methyltransferase [bacterium]